MSKTGDDPPWPASAEPESLESLRAELDRIDDAILELLGDRSDVVRRVQRAKRASGAPVYVAKREQAQLRRLLAANEEGGGRVPEGAIQWIFREILAASRSLQHELQTEAAGREAVQRRGGVGAVPEGVAYLGPEGTFSELAARDFFGGDAPLQPVDTIPDVFAAVAEGAVDRGIVPIENSSEGMVAITLDSLVDHEGLEICAEYDLPVIHLLMVRSGGMGEIRKVVSHGQSLGQCRHWLRRHLPGVPVVQAASNSRAASEAAEHDGVAAIAGRPALERYGLKLLAEGIQDRPDNVTRFVVLRRSEGLVPEGATKVSLVFSAKNQPGALFACLQPLAEEKIDLSKIFSRPNRATSFEYDFFVDFRGHPDEPRVVRAIESMGRHCQSVRRLGAYPVSEPS